MNGKKIFSIIIPIYNNGNRIKNAIESVQRQFQNLEIYEIIIIDDGSTDKISNVMKNYLTNDMVKFIRLEKNQGVSNARNIGLRAAQGDYIQFVDSDDELINYDFHKILKTFDEKVDMISFGALENSGDKTYNYRVPDKPEVISYLEGMDRVIFDENVSGFLVNKVFKRNIIIQNEIFLNKNLHYAEDEVFVLEYLSAIKNIALIDETYYQFNLNNDSIRGNIRTNEQIRPEMLKKVFTSLDSWELIITMLENSQDRIRLEMISDIVYFGASIYVKGRRRKLRKEYLKQRQRQLKTHTYEFFFKTNKYNFVKKIFALLRIFNILKF